jgi:hypothetical protein
MMAMFVHLSQQGGKHVRTLQIEIIAWPVKIGRHGADENPAILPGVGLAKPDAGNLRDGIRFVCRLEGSRQQSGFLERLRGQPGVNARTAKEQEFLDVEPMRRLDKVVLDLQIIQQELDRKIVVRLDAAYARRGHHHDLGTDFLEKARHGRALRQVHLGMGAGYDLSEAVCLEVPHDGAPHQTAVSGYKDGFLFHAR